MSAYTSMLIVAIGITLMLIAGILFGWIAPELALLIGIVVRVLVGIAGKIWEEK